MYTIPSAVGTWRRKAKFRSTVGGLHSPCLSVYPPIKYIWSLWTKRSVSAQSHPPTLDHRPSGLSFLVLLWGTHYRITP